MITLRLMPFCNLFLERGFVVSHIFQIVLKDSLLIKKDTFDTTYLEKLSRNTSFSPLVNNKTVI